MAGRLTLALAAMLLAGLPIAGRAAAQEGEPRVVAYLRGYRCMMPTEASPRGASGPPPILVRPRAGASRLGSVSDAVITDDPVRVVNGYARVLRPDGGRGWVRRDRLRPWTTAASPGLRCLPALLSDGQRRVTFAHPG